MPDRLMETMILGNGWFGNAFAKFYGTSVTPCDVTDRTDMANIIKSAMPQVVINCAGKTGRPNIDNLLDCRGQAIAVNANAPAFLSRICADIGVMFVHISSGCIYATGADIPENRLPNPCSFYGRTKWAGEKGIHHNHLILRPRMPFDGLSDRCIIRKLAGYSEIMSEENSYTYLPDFIAAADHLIRRRAIGVFHVVNSGSGTSEKIMQLLGLPYRLTTQAELLRTGAIREPRSNCTLSIGKLTATGFEMPPVTERMAAACRKFAALTYV